MSKLNCWEFHKCEKNPGGKNVGEEGPCPASTFEAADNFLGGKNGGRACSYISGTFCSQTLPGTQRNLCKPSSDMEEAKLCTCCRFYRLLKKEHNEELSLRNFLTYVKKRGATKNLHFTTIELHPSEEEEGKDKDL